MRAVLTVLAEELRRLKAAGVSTVSVSDATLASLRRVVRARGAARVHDAGAEAAAVETGSVPREERSVVPDPAAREPLPEPPDRALPPPPVVEVPSGDKATRLAWLRDHVLAHPVCCQNVRSGKKVVLGVGDPDAKILFCGEAPGAEEEVQGEPFVGPAGQLLTKMIQAMGLQREDVYIGNIMNWRPQLPGPSEGEQIGNRPPTAEEMAFCLPFLRAQIEIVRPEVIVALGATAARGLLGTDSFKALGEIRGRWKQFEGTPVMVTYHPSYILRNQSNRSKRAIWEDLLQVMERCGLSISDKQRRFFIDK